MRQTSAYNTSRSNNYTPAAVVPFFRSRWGLLSLLAVGSGLYLYQRRGGSIRGLLSQAWSAGSSLRSRIGAIAPSVSGSSADTTGDVGTFGAGNVSSSGLGSTPSTRQTSPNSGI
jgi:hypothetical protein